MTKRSEDSVTVAHQEWEALAQYDAMWAVLSDPNKHGDRWDPEEFFETGKREIALTKAWVEENGLTFGGGQALDFGCGVGRLTQALAHDFEVVVGIDISETMIEMAQKHNREGERVIYLRNEAADLALVEDESFDFIYTSMVLQHVAPSLAKQYIAEFAKKLRTGGAVAFQLPTERKPDKSPWKKYRRLLGALFPEALRMMYRKALGRPLVGAMPMSAIPQPEVHALLTEVGLELKAVAENKAAGNRWISHKFLAVKS